MSLDYRQIIEDLRDEDVFRLLSELGGDPIDSNDYILSKTICHHDNPEEANYKLYYYKNTHLFYCYSEDGAMSIFNFLKHYYDCRGIEYDWYNDILQVILNCSASDLTRGKDVYRSCRGDYEARKGKELEVYPNGIMDIFVKYYPVEWLNDGISKEAMDKFGIRYSISRNKIIIPHYNIDGELIGIRGRTLDPVEAEEFGKYVPIQIEEKWYSHPLSMNLYGLDKTKENVKKTGTLFLFEAEKSVLQMESFDMPNCAAATCGNKLNKFQIDLVMKSCAPRNIVICYDNEEEKGKDKYFNELYKMCKKYSNYANMSFIYDKKGLSKFKDSPSDNGQEIFEELLKGKVNVK